MKYLTLWLEAPLQSWGYDSKFDLRATLEFPTRSGIFGLLLAASGDSGEQLELLEALRPSKLTILAYKSLNAAPASSLCDFHMVGNGYDTKDRWQRLNIPRTATGTLAVGGGAKITYRYYLSDKRFAAILALSDNLAAKFAAALRQPTYDLYLGRKCCVPTDMIYRGVFDSAAAAHEALAQIAAAKALTVDFCVEECEITTPQAIILYDDPVRFGVHHIYRARAVLKRTIEQED